MQRCEDNVAARLNGNALQPLAGVSVTVISDATGLPASLYTDNGITPLAQPLITDDNGYYGFYAANGEYTITFTGVRIASFSRKVVLQDPDDNPYAHKSELAAGSGSSLVAFTAAGAGAVLRSVQDKLREIVSITDYPNLRAAIDALPSAGGVIHIPVGRYPAGVWKYDTNYMAKPNVTLRGAKMPWPSANMDRLDGGSVIEGRFNVFADNFTVENLGFDCGKFVCDRDYPGFNTHTANHPNGDTWDALAFAQPNQGAPLPAAKNLSVHNVVALNRDPLSYGHAMLLEGFDGANIGKIFGICSIHGVVLKGKNPNAEFIGGYASSGDHVIFKSDTYAPGGNIKAGTVEADFRPAGVGTPWFTEQSSQSSLFLNPATADLTGVKIGSLRVRGAQALIRATGTTSARILDNVQIANCEADGFGSTTPIALLFSGAVFKRCRIGNMTVTNVFDGIAYQQDAGFSDAPLMIGHLTFENVSLRAIQCLNYGRVIVDVVRAQTVTTMYSIANTGRICVGYESLVGVTTKFGLNPPALTAGWQQIGGFSTFALTLHNYGVSAQGLLAKTASPSAAVFSLPAYLRPAEPTRMRTAARNGSNVDSDVLASVGGGDANFIINDGAGIVGAENFLSLDNLWWRVD